MHEIRQIGHLLQRASRFYRRHGLSASLDKAAVLLSDRRAPPLRSYAGWTRRSPPPRAGGRGLLLSLLVPVRDPAPQHLDELYASVAAQDHARWELLLCDDGSREPAVGRRLADLADRDRRVSVLRHSESRGIGAATNAAAAAARGELLLLLDHDDLLARGVLGRLAGAFAADPALDLLYTDEDHLLPWGARAAPTWKPGPSPWLLLGFNYVTHLVALRRRLWDALGGLRPEFDGAQDHDLLLRACEVGRVGHLPGIGYHWRRAPGSVSSSSTAKPWAFEAGRRAVSQACERRGLPVSTVQPGALPGVWRLGVQPPARPPAVRVVVHGNEVGCRAWLSLLAAAGPVLQLAGASVNRWPARASPEQEEDGQPAAGALPGEDTGLAQAPHAGSAPEDEPLWLIVDGSLRPDLAAVATLLAWAALPGVGGVAASAAGPRARRHLGYALRRDGVAEPILPGLPRRALGPSLLAAAPREVAASAHGLLLLAAPPAALAAELAGRAVDTAAVLTLSLVPATRGQALLFHPDVLPREADGRRFLPLPLDLRVEPAFARVHAALPDDFWSGPHDRFCPRHELLAGLGLPRPDAGQAVPPQPAASSSALHTTA